MLTVHAGRSAPGQRAAASHTAAIAAPLITREALFEQAGIIATSGLSDLLDVTDEAQRQLAGILPSGAAVGGPVDTGAGVPAEAFRHGLETLAADKGVDAVLSLIVPTAVADLVPVVRAPLPVPAATVILGQPEAIRLLPGETNGDPPVPCYAYPESAARALGRAARYGEWLATPAGTVPDLDRIRAADARALIAEFLGHLPGGGWLPAAVTSELLRCYGLPPIDALTAGDAAAVARAAAELGCPVVMKADVPGLLHKSDVGAVRLDLRTPDDARRAFTELAVKFGGQLNGVLVQPMVTGGVELIIGVVQEPVFGPLVVFGLGGVATEVLGDHSARLAPLTDTDASDMIHSIRAAPLLLGHRGTRAVDLAALTDTLLRVSRLAADLPEVAELDLNPVIARPDGMFAVDARVRVTSQEAADPFLRRLR